MDLYTLFKFLHVLTAIAWVGGGLTLLASSLMAGQGSSDTALFNTLDVMNRLGKTWFVPTSFLTVIFGAVATTLAGLWAEAWVIIGLLGFASTFFTGLLLLEPLGQKLGAFIAEGKPELAKTEGRKLLSIAKFDYVVMLIVIADMVLKPSWSDLVPLLAFAVLIAIGAAIFLVPALKPSPAVA